MVITTHDREVEVPSNVRVPTDDSQSLHIVCLSPQPWHVELPTNRQQVMTHVARSGHRVLYVDTGTFVGRHLVDLIRKSERRSLLKQLLDTETVALGVRVTKAPALVPWGHRFRLAAKLNAALTAWMVRRRLRRDRHPPVLWLYDPCFATCIGRVGEHFAVYDCVDDYAEQSGADSRKRAFLAESDAIAASRSRLVFATASGLVERHHKHNENTHLVGNVGDFAHFASAADRSIALRDLASGESPVVGFAGNFLSDKVDFALLEAIAVRRPDWTLLLIGPAHHDTRPALERIGALENVRLVGAVAYAELPRYVAAFDVATIPYLSNAYTRSCFPLKTFEYLAAGKPVVASGLPELQGLEPYVMLADNAESFISLVDDALARTSPSEIAARQEIAARNTWETRTRRLLELVAAEL